MSQTTVIANTVKAEVDKLQREYVRKEFQGIHSGSVRFGLFGNLVGAEVSAEQRIDVGKIDGGVCVRHTLVMACTGFGCADPLIEVATRRLRFDCDHGDVTEASRQIASQHAQSHAETCRAMPRPTA